MGVHQTSPRTVSHYAWSITWLAIKVLAVLLLAGNLHAVFRYQNF